MSNYKLGVMEKRFAELIWAHAPIASGDLVKLCEQEFQWKKSTTYTMLRRLCQQGLFENKESLVSALLSEQEFTALQSEQFVKESFGGSLPQFLAAFIRRKKLTEQEIDELQKLIDQGRG